MLFFTVGVISVLVIGIGLTELRSPGLVGALQDGRQTRPRPHRSTSDAGRAYRPDERAPYGSEIFTRSLRGRSVEVDRLSDHLSEVKAQQILAETSYDDPMEAAKTICFSREALPLIERKLKEARAEITPIEERSKPILKRLMR
jgi:hypothetical protein